MAKTIEFAGKVPPQSLEAERAVLGAILLEPGLLPRAVELLVPEEFYKEAHRKIFEAMIRLFERGESPDTILVAETLRREGVFEEIGGHTVLATLQEEGTVATQFQAYAGVVREKALLRDMIRVAREIVEEGYEETDDVQALLDRAEQMLFRISQRRFQRSAFPVREILDAAIKHIETLYHRKEDITGLATGFDRPGQADVGAPAVRLRHHRGSARQPARPPSRSTSPAHAAVDLRRPALIFSLEMSKEQLVQRLICAEARVGLAEVRTGYPEAAGLARASSTPPAGCPRRPSSSTTAATSRSWRRAPRRGASRRSTASSWS